MIEIDAEVRAGRRLYGNHFTGEKLAEWFAAEQSASFELESAPVLPGAPAKFPYGALYDKLGAALRGRHYPVCVALGCGDGWDLEKLRLDIGRVIAIEPTEGYWSDEVAGIAAEYRKPLVSGEIELPDGSVDLVLCMHVLHHVANVETVIGEFARVLRPQGRVLLIEPIGSMGDFRRARPGLTRHERGIPPALLRAFLSSAGLTVERASLHCTPGLPELASRLRLVGDDTRWLVTLDSLISRAMAFNVRYWRDTLWKKIAPRRASYLAVKAARHPGA